MDRAGSRPRVWADEAFVLFASAVGERFDGFVLFGRSRSGGPPANHPLPATAELVELPHYESWRRPLQVLRASIGTIDSMWRGLGQVDGVWVLGPNPFGVLFVCLALLRGKRVALGVRQDTLRYFRTRLPSRGRRPALVVAWLLDRLYRLLSRHLPATVVGAELARGYGSMDRPALPMTVTLVRAHDVASAPPVRNWDGTIELLTVGRIDREKNPLLLLEALARLEQAQPGRFVLRWVGTGPLADLVGDRAKRLGIGEQLQLTGYVPFGPQLLELYRSAHLFVHVSLTEGVPQVLFEALACGTPVVATDVGGVRGALLGGSAGLLVPSGDVDALVGAIDEVVTDSALRAELIANGLDLARATTLEAEADRVASFLAGHAAENPTGG